MERHQWHGRCVRSIRDKSRLILAISLSKAFGAMGAAIVMPDEEPAKIPRRAGSSPIFNTPIPSTICRELNLTLCSWDGTLIHMKAGRSSMERGIKGSAVGFPAVPLNPRIADDAHASDAA